VDAGHDFSDGARGKIAHLLPTGDVGFWLRDGVSVPFCSALLFIYRRYAHFQQDQEV